MSLCRSLRKALRATVLGLSDPALSYVRAECEREAKRRRLAVRARRKRGKVLSDGRAAGAGGIQATPEG